MNNYESKAAQVLGAVIGQPLEEWAVPGGKAATAVAAAFINRQSKKVGNAWSDGQTYRLYGNTIAKWAQGGALLISCAGYNTKTTHAHLGAILDAAHSEWRVVSDKGGPALWNDKQQLIPFPDDEFVSIGQPSAEAKIHAGFTPTS